MKQLSLRSIARILTLIAVIIGGIYRYQHPTRYRDNLKTPGTYSNISSDGTIDFGSLIGYQSVDFTAIDLNNRNNLTQTGDTITSGDSLTGQTQTLTGDVDIIKLILAQLEDRDNGSTRNPFGEEQTTIDMPFGTNTGIISSGQTITPEDTIMTGQNPTDTNDGQTITGTNTQASTGMTNQNTGIANNDTSGTINNNGTVNNNGDNSGSNTTPTPQPESPRPIPSFPFPVTGQNNPPANITPPSNTTQQPQSQPTTTQDTLVCIAPRGRSIPALDRTFAFKYNKAVNNVCVIEKRICSQGILGGSYTQHTCYFDQPNGYYEYLGSTGTDSSKLIYETEIKLGIDEASNRTHTINIGTINNANTYNYNYNYNNSSNSNSQGSNNGTSQTQSGSATSGGYTYVDDTTDINYRLTPGYQGPNGPKIDENDRTISTGPVIRYDLGPIKPRTPEVKISAARDAQINPNTNGVQGVINNTAASPVLNYSTQSPSGPNSPSTNQPASCSTPRGYSVMHNQNIIAFERATVPQGDVCQSEYRTCSYGYLRGNYTQQTCTIVQSQ